MTYDIFADSSCDLDQELLSSLEIHCMQMTYLTSDGPRINDEEDPKTFYDRMRNNETVTTAALNSSELAAAFVPSLKSGRDVLYLCFSSGLSSQYETAVSACLALEEQFPERTVRVVDTLCESAGYGMLLFMAAQKRLAGETPEQIIAFVRDQCLKICHWFTVDDLRYLKRGGRLSGTAVVIGGLLDIKPVLKMDDTGHLVGVKKVRGRKKSLQMLAEQCAENAEAGSQVWIAHADSDLEANTLKEMIVKKGVSVEKIFRIGPVIGAHCGPGTLAVFFMAKNR